MMSTDFNLVLIDGEDMTSQIKRWNYKEKKYWITYENGLVSPYNYENVKFFRDPEKIDLEDKMIFKDKIRILGVDKLLRFEQFTRIKYVNGQEEMLASYRVRVVSSVLLQETARNCFEYLKQLSHVVGLNIQGKESYWGDQCSKLEYIRDDSILAAYLNGELSNQKKEFGEIVYPFGFNISQKHAIERALSEKISIIEDPSGMGKIQTMLNIISNTVIRGERIAVMTDNQSTVRHLTNKLAMKHVDFIAVDLNSENRNGFFTKCQKEKISDLHSWELDEERHVHLQAEMRSLLAKLNQMFDYKSQLSKLQKQYQKVYIEYQYFLNYYEEKKEHVFPMIVSRNTNSDTILNYLVDLEKHMPEQPATIFQHLLSYLRFGIKNKEFHKNTQQKKILVAQKVFYELWMIEMEKKIDKLQFKLKDNQLAEEMCRYTELSVQLFQAGLVKRYSYAGGGSVTEEGQFLTEVLHQCPVVLGTTEYLLNSLQENMLYDYIIIDQASQVDILAGTLALSCARKAIMIGDRKQLLNDQSKVVTSKINEIFLQFRLQDAYRYSNSILSSVDQLFKHVTWTLLKDHYYCHSNIIRFCNLKWSNKLTPRRRFVVVTDNHCVKNSNIRDLISDIQYCNLQLMEAETKIYSVFDHLYQCYHQKRKYIRQKSNQVIKYDIDHLVYGMLKQMLPEGQEGSKFDIAVHVPLAMLLKDLSNLAEEELKYVQNINARVDFLIYSKISKTPVLALDRYSFHQEKKRQMGQEQIKNQIFEKFTLPYVQFMISERNDQERFIIRLSECI